MAVSGVCSAGFRYHSVTTGHGRGDLLYQDGGWEVPLRTRGVSQSVLNITNPATLIAIREEKCMIKFTNRYNGSDNSDWLTASVTEIVPICKAQ